MDKSILITLLILVALVVVYVFKDDLYVSTVSDGSTAGFNSFRSIDFDKVSKIKLAKGKGDPVEVRKEKDGWVVTTSFGAPAKNGKMKEILDSLKGIKESGVAGELSASHRDFEVDKRGGGFLHLFDDGGKKLGELIVGKSVPMATFGDNQVFVRFNGENTTFKVDSDIRSKANLQSDVEGKRYIQTEIFELPAGEEFFEVRLVREGKDDLVVERGYRIKEGEKKEKSEGDSEEKKSDEEKPEKEPEKEEYYVVTSGNETIEVDQKEYAARGLLDRAKTIRIEDAAEPKPPAEYGLDKPRLKAVVSYRRKKDESAEPGSVTLLFGDAYKDDKGEDKGYYFVFQGAGNDERVWKFGKWNFSSWNKEWKEFQPDPKEEKKKETKAGDKETGEPTKAPAPLPKAAAPK